MPLRRRPPEPSPRVRALLERAREGAGTGAGEGIGGGTGGGTGGGSARESVPWAGGWPTGSDAGADEESVRPWQPDRAWLATPAHRGERTDSVRGQGAQARTAALDAGQRQAGRHRRPMPPGPRFLTLPAPLHGARLTGPRAAVVGLLLVVLVAAIGFGARVALARASAEPEPLRTSSGSALEPRPEAGAFASSTTASGGGGPPTTSGGRSLTVHVVGQVARPGVVQLGAGARVSDALDRAGGAVRGADLGSINLARLLVDGEQIRVPRPGEFLQGAGDGPAGPGAGPGTGGGAAGGGAGGGSGALVDLNTATLAQLEELPGVGPVLAQRILDWRTEHGRFTSVDELGEVSGIGDKIFAQLQPKVTV